MDRDAFQLTVTPVIAVPRCGDLQPDQREGGGERYLVAADGLYLEVRSPWLRAITRIAPLLSGVVPTPFGSVDEAHWFRCGPVPHGIWQAFHDEAVKAYPEETAGIVVWHERDQTFRLVMTVTEATAQLAHYRIPPLESGEYRVVDIHSHAAAPAFFSGTDDIDDAHEIKTAVVIGNVRSAAPTVAARLCIKGKFIAMPTATIEGVLRREA